MYACSGLVGVLSRSTLRMHGCIINHRRELAIREWDRGRWWTLPNVHAPGLRSTAGWRAVTAFRRATTVAPPLLCPHQNIYHLSIENSSTNIYRIYYKAEYMKCTTKNTTSGNLSTIYANCEIEWGSEN